MRTALERAIPVGALVVAAVLTAGPSLGWWPEGWTSSGAAASGPAPTAPIPPAETHALSPGTATLLPPFVAPRDRADTGLMTIYLDTADGADIPDEGPADGTFTVSASSSMPECRGLQKTAATFNVRGNFTATLPKKPYTVHLGQAADLCEAGAAKKWTLLADWEDRSALRTAASLFVGQQLDHLPFTPQTFPADLYLNSRYQGSYQLVESVEIHRNRVLIDALRHNQDGRNDTGLALTGGYLLEWDHRRKLDHVFEVDDKGSVGLRDPEDEADGSGVTPHQLGYISTFVNEANSALEGERFTDPDLGWRKYIDEDAAVDFYLAQEFTKTYDGAFYSSVFMYKSRDTVAGPGKLFLGPMWDYDESLGNGTTPAIWAEPEGWYCQGEDEGHTERQSRTTWFDRLLEDPGFAQHVRDRWREVYPQLQALPAFIDARAPLVERSVRLSQGLWDPQATDDPGPLPRGTDWDAQVALLRDWTVRRLAWMNEQLG